MRTKTNFDWLGTWRIVMLPLSRALWGTLERPIEDFSRKEASTDLSPAFQDFSDLLYPAAR